MIEPTSRRRRGAGITIAVLFIVAGALGVEVVWLSTKLSQARRPTRLDMPARAEDPTRGEFPYLFATDPSGRARMVPSDSEPGPLLLFVSADGCEACDEAAIGWDRLARASLEVGVPVAHIHIGTSDRGPRVESVERSTLVGPLSELVGATDGFPSTVLLDRHRAVVLGISGAPGSSQVEILIATLYEHVLSAE